MNNHLQSDKLEKMLKVSRNMPVGEETLQRRRSIAIACTLGMLVVIFFLVTIFKMGPHVLQRPL